jgi:serine/threonine-protein kinase RsbW
MAENSRGTQTFAGRYENLAVIDAFVRQFACDAGFQTEVVYLIETAVDEACSNIIEHAYGGEEKGEIECTCGFDLVGLTIVLKDHGCAFDPTKIPEPNPQVTLKRRKHQGVGLYIIKKIMDEVHFDCCTPDGNILTMFKRLV